MRADSQDAVVALGSQTRSQATAYVRTQLDEAITELASAPQPPHAIFVTGSAGGGKSGAAEFQRQMHADLFSLIVEDATHADAPGEDQADSLARRLAPLADDAARRPTTPLLVAANIGMLIQLAPMWTERGHQFATLVHKLFTRLGLPTEEPAKPPALPLEIAVLNLDHRPTSGEQGLLTAMLHRLDPGDPDSLLNTERCTSCPAITHCPAHANAALLSTVAGPAFDTLARRAAVERGRSDTPRALWDLISRVVLPPRLYDRFADPCEASLEAHRKNDVSFVLTGLLPISAFCAGGEVGPRVAAQDPACLPTRQGYEAFADAGLRPAMDAEPVRRLLRKVEEAGMSAPALKTAADALANGFGSLNPSEEREWRNIVARTVVGCLHFLGDLPDPQAEEEGKFLRALAAYDRWQTAQLTGHVSDGLLEEVEAEVGAMVSELGQGFAALFGALALGNTYLPVHNYDSRDKTSAYVEFRISLPEAPPMSDRPTRANPDGTRLVGYRPMAVTLSLEPDQDGSPGTEFAVDLPTYRLLCAAKRGMASSGDAERTYALRRAAGTLARIATERQDISMLVDERASGCRYVVEPKRSFSGKLTLSARMVTE